MLLNSREASAYLGISMLYLRNLRQECRITFECQTVNNVKRCFYRQESLDEWATSNNWKVKRIKEKDKWVVIASEKNAQATNA